MPRVSVIIPTRNRERFITECLESVKKQTYSDWEIILLDSQSSDKTIDVAQASGVPFRLEKVPHRGPGAARNRGIEKSDAEFIAFLDSDDCWLAPKLQRQLNILDSDPKIGAVYTRVALFETGEPFAEKCPDKVLPQGDIALDVLLDPAIITTSSIIFRRSYWDKVGGIDEETPIGEDWEWFVRLAVQTPVASIQEPLVKYRVHNENTTKNIDQNWPFAERMVRNSIEAYEKAKGRLDKSARRKIWYKLYHTYGLSHLFQWQPRQALPFLSKAIQWDPWHPKDYGYLAASLVPGSILRKIQSWRGHQ